MMTATREKGLQVRRLQARIEAEVEELNSVVKETEEQLVRFTDLTPDTLSLRGFGDLLHDFYTGLEKIFEAIAEFFDGGLPTGLHWHRELLEEMGLSLEGSRPAVLRQETVEALGDYLRFRHLYRHIYGHELKWEKMRPLLEEMRGVAGCAFEDLRQFCGFLRDLAGRLEG